MSIKAGRVGVNPSQVNPVDGSILSGATSGYTKQEADAKFLTQTDAASTYESKSDASTAHNALQPKTLAVPIKMLDGSKLTVESALQGLNEQKQNGAELFKQKLMGSVNGTEISFSFDSSVGRETSGVVVNPGSVFLLSVGRESAGALTADTALYILSAGRDSGTATYVIPIKTDTRVTNITATKPASSSIVTVTITFSESGFYMAYLDKIG